MKMKKKIILYCIAITVFLAVWAAYLWQVDKDSSRSADYILKRRMYVIKSYIHKNIDNKAAGLRKTLYAYETANGANMEQVFSSLVEWRDSGTEKKYMLYVLNSEGVSVRHEESSSLPKLAQAILRESSYNGSVVTNIFFDKDQNNGHIATIIPFFNSPGYYLAVVEPSPQFASVIFDNISFLIKDIGVFNELDAMVRFSPEEENEGASDKALKEKAYKFHNSRQPYSIEPLTSDAEYGVHMQLEQPPGWYLGGRVSIPEAIPLFSRVYTVALVVLSLTVFMFFISAVSDFLAARKKFSYDPEIDRLTGLVNETGMYNALAAFLKRPVDGVNSLVCIEIANFSRINNMLGYAAGDKWLCAIGGMLDDNYDCAVRIHGNIFFVVVKRSANIIGELRKKLEETVASNFGSSYEQLISFNFGVYNILHRDRSCREMYDCAILAVKNARNLPGSDYIVYNRRLQKEVEQRKLIEMNMLNALSKEEFLLYIQPKFDVKTHECCGGEALVRWASDQMGFLSPDQFIPLFERNGFIAELDFYMFSKVLELLQNSFDKGQKLYPISVNQSKNAIIFPNYIERLKSLCDKYTVPRSYIEIEVTESAFEKDYAIIADFLYDMKSLGFSIAMDDFGSGYSSLNTLRELPVDTIKIDKGFLHEAETSERSKKIIKSVVNMSRELNTKTVCEGVETKAQLEFLKSINCDCAQGYLFATPMLFSQYISIYIEE